MSSLSRPDSGPNNASLAQSIRRPHLPHALHSVAPSCGRSFRPLSAVLLVVLIVIVISLTLRPALRPVELRRWAAWKKTSRQRGSRSACTQLLAPRGHRVCPGRLKQQKLPAAGRPRPRGREHGGTAAAPRRAAERPPGTTEIAATPRPAGDAERIFFVPPPPIDHHHFAIFHTSIIHTRKPNVNKCLPWAPGHRVCPGDQFRGVYREAAPAGFAPEFARGPERELSSK